MRRNRPNSVWTDARRAMLRDLWTRGLTLKQCAATLALWPDSKDKGRSAVAGMVRRMNLAGRPTPVRQRSFKGTPRFRAPRVRATSVITPSKKVTPPGPKARGIDPNDQAARVAQAYLAMARAADARKQQMRGQYA